MTNVVLNMQTLPTHCARLPSLYSFVVKLFFLFLICFLGCLFVGINVIIAMNKKKPWKNVLLIIKTPFLVFSSIFCSDFSCLIFHAAFIRTFLYNTNYMETKKCLLKTNNNNKTCKIFHMGMLKLSTLKKTYTTKI